MYKTILKHIGQVLSLAALLGCVSLSVQAQNQRETIVVAASSTSVNHMWAYWGKERGIFAKYGIDLQPVDNIADPIAALAGGQVQFVANGVPTQQAAIRGVPVKVVMVTAKDNLGIYAGPAVKSIQDLRGKKILGPFDSLKDVLRRNGVDPDKEVTWVVSKGSALVNLELVKRGEADAYAGFPPTRTQAEEIGLHEVFRVGQFVPGGPVSIVGTTDKMIAERPQTVNRMIRAALDTLTDMRSSKEAIVEYTMRVMNYSRASAEEAYATLLRDAPTDGLVSDEALQITLESTQKGQGNTQKIPLSQVWNFTMLREVLKTRK